MSFHWLPKNNDLRGSGTSLRGSTTAFRDIATNLLANHHRWPTHPTSVKLPNGTGAKSFLELLLVAWLAKLFVTQWYRKFEFSSFNIRCILFFVHIYWLPSNFNVTVVVIEPKQTLIKKKKDPTKTLKSGRGGKRNNERNFPPKYPRVPQQCSGMSKTKCQQKSQGTETMLHPRGKRKCPLSVKIIFYLCLYSIQMTTVLTKSDYVIFLFVYN